MSAARPSALGVGENGAAAAAHSSESSTEEPVEEHVYDTDAPTAALSHSNSSMNEQAGNADTTQEDRSSKDVSDWC